MDPLPLLPIRHGPKLGSRMMFSHLEPLVYLNHAAISPASDYVRATAFRVVDDYATHGVHAVARWIAQRERLRKTLAGLIHAAPSDIALLPSTSHSVIALSQCYPWQAGDRVLLFDGEFPTNVTPWQRAADTFSLEIITQSLTPWHDDSGDGLQALEDALTGGVRLVAVSAVQFQTGLRMPLKEMAALCHQHGAELFVDAMQACGVIPFDVSELDIDYLACGSHKWLMGLEGAGFLYVRAPLAKQLVPRIASWLSHEDPFAFLFEGAGKLRYDRPIRSDASFLEVGAMNAVGFAALEGAIHVIQQLGVASIYAHVQAYHDALELGLTELGFTSVRAAKAEHRSGILSFHAPEGSQAKDIVNAMIDKGGVSCSMPDGLVRFAPHWPNALDEPDQVIATAEHILQS